MLTMSQQRALAERLKTELEQQPGRYRARLIALTLLGYSVPLLMLSLSLGLAITLIVMALTSHPQWLVAVLKVVWLPLIYGLALLRALWVRFSPPEGYALPEAEAPQLFAEVERLRVAAGAPKLRGIYIHEDFNAAAASLPRAWGLLPSRHYLILGLPLMQSLSSEQLRTVIAHEFGHFGGQHGRFSTWIYRMRSSWQQIMQSFETAGFSRQVLGRFLAWYSPRFDVCSLALVRHHEYQADQTAVKLAGAKPAAEALLRITAVSDWLEREFWPGINRLMANQEQPPADIYRLQAESVAQMPLPGAEKIRQLLDESDDPDDTHPSIAKRLAAMGQVAESLDISAPGISAASDWLGESQEKISAAFSLAWKDYAEPYWEVEYNSIQRQKKQLVELQAKPDLSPAEKSDLLRLQLVLNPDIDVEAHCRAGLAELPADAWMHLRLGQHLLDKEDAEGIGHLEAAMARDPDFAMDALGAMYGYYRKQRNDAALDDVGARINAEQERLDSISRQRATLQRKDRIKPHQLPPETLHELQTLIASHDWIKRVWLVEKELDGYHATPHFLILVEPKRMALMNNARFDDFNNVIELPGTWLIFTHDGERAVIRKVKRTPGAKIYPQ